MKKFFRNSIAIASLAVAGLAMAATSQLPPSVTISASVVGGNAVISWSDVSLPVAGVEHYVGHGSKGGFIQTINVAPGAKQATLVDVAKNGPRFNLKLANGTWLHLECGGNDRTVMPTLVGLGVDCSYTDPGTGHKVGALVLK